MIHLVKGIPYLIQLQFIWRRFLNLFHSLLIYEPSSERHETILTLYECESSFLAEIGKFSKSAIVFGNISCN